MDRKTYFIGKKITLMGLGLLGRGAGDAYFLAESGADLIVTDMKSAEDLKESLDQLKNFKNITFSLGGHNLEDFRNRDLIIKAAGVPDDSTYLAEARKNNISVEMSTSLFARFAIEAGARIIGITGTRGKSTVTHLLYEILKEGTERRIFLGGNVRGVATLPFLKEIKKGDSAVLELDSWQLQGFGTDKISPHIAIFTTFFDDHLNYYKGDRDAYLDDKANIFKYQTADDFLIVGRQCSELIQEKYGNVIKGKIIIADHNDFPADWKLNIPGEHNRYDAALAIVGARTLGIPNTIIQKAVEKFKSVPGRLEFIREIQGVKIYNDTTATTPEAALAALHSLSDSGKDKNVVLIMGGADKNLDMSQLIIGLEKYCKKVIMLPGTGTDKLKTDYPHLKAAVTPTLEDAVRIALSEAESGNTIVLSPAFASFGMFKNEFDRGERFNKIVNDIV